MEGEIRRALVLSGGGAKGAYAFGCLKAFRESNIHFDAVAGTSVGALNALLWSTNSLSEGQKLWDELSFSTVYPVRFLNPKWYPKFILQLLAGVLVFLNMIVGTWKGLDHPAHFFTAFFLTVLNSFPFLVSILILSTLVWSMISELAQTKDFDFFGFTELAGGIIVLSLPLFPLWILVHIFRGFREGRAKDAKHFLQQIAFWMYLFISIPLALFCVIAFGETVGGLVKSSPTWGNIFLAALIFIVYATYAWLIYTLIRLPFLILDFAEQILSKLGTVLDAAPLYKTVENILHAKSAGIPTFAVTASSRLVHDPEQGDWYVYESKLGPAGSSLPISYGLHGENKWVPYYVDISALSPEAAALYCVASAALPFGIVPSVEITETAFVDGGVIDNCPFYPFVEDLPAEEIYIVLLDRFESCEVARETSKITVDSWNEFKRLQTIVQLPPPPRQKSKDFKRVVVEYEKRDVLPKLEFFYPQNESLGNFLTGTLNFNGDYASKIMQTGYEETLQRLAEIENGMSRRF